MAKVPNVVYEEALSKYSDVMKRSAAAGYLTLVMVLGACGPTETGILSSAPQIGLKAATSSSTKGILHITNTGKASLEYGVAVSDAAWLTISKIPGTVLAPGEQAGIELTATCPDTAETLMGTVVVSGPNTLHIPVALECSVDVTPDPFVFPAVHDAAPDTEVVSQEITVSGLTKEAAASVAGGTLLRNGHPFTGRTVGNGDRLALKVRSQSSPGAAAAATLTVGTYTTTFEVTTNQELGDTTPDPFTFQPIVNAEPGSQLLSSEITVKGITAPASLSLTHGVSVINGIEKGTSAVSVNAGDRVAIRLTAPATRGVTLNVTVSIGGVTSTFPVSTLPPIDDRPATFTFLPQAGVTPGSAVTSNAITVSDINVPVPISVVNGVLIVNDEEFTGTTVKAGDKVAVRLIAPNYLDADAEARVTIGGVTGVFGVTTAKPDLVPDAFSFDALQDAPLKTRVKSATVTVSGINAATTISVTGGVLYVNDELFEGVRVKAGDRVAVEIITPDTYETVKTAKVIIGGVEGAFAVTTQAKDSSPDPFQFKSQTGVALGSTVTSEEITVSGINAEASIAVTGGTLLVNGKDFTGSTVKAGDKVAVKAVAAKEPGVTTSAKVVIGGVEGVFNVTSTEIDKIPDAFAFTAQNDVQPGVLVMSEEITVTGINTPTEIAVENGVLVLNGNDSTASTVESGDKVAVKVLTPETVSTKASAKVTIGGVSAEFSVTTAKTDTTPEPFVFNEVKDAPLGVQVTSNPVVVRGLSAPAPVVVDGGTLLVNGERYTGSAVSNGMVLTVRLTSSEQVDTATVATLNVGGVQADFRVITQAVDSTPSQFTFIPVEGALAGSKVKSNEITVVGIDAPASISVKGGAVYVNGKLLTGTTVNSGDKVAVEVTAPTELGATASAVVTVGGVHAQFDVTTEGKDTTPDGFSFEDRKDVLPGTTVTSAAVTVAGINAPAPITIEGGVLIINGVTSTQTTVKAGDKVAIRMTAPDAPNESATARLTIGGVAGTFTVVTSAPDPIPDAFTFNTVKDVEPGAAVTSNTVTVSGINTVSPITVEGGTLMVNGTEFTGSVVKNGDTVAVRLTASNERGGTTAARVTIGNVSATFEVQTKQ